MRPKKAKSVRSRPGRAYPADLVLGLGRAGHDQRQAGGQPGRDGGQEPQLPAVVVVPGAQHRPGDVTGDHRQRHQVDVAEQRQAGRVGHPARRRRPVQGAQQQQRGQRRDQHRERVEPDLLGEPRHARHQGEHQPGGQAGPGAGQPPADQRHARRRGRHGEHGQRAHRVGGIPERRDPPVQQQVVGQLGGAGVAGASRSGSAPGGWRTTSWPARPATARGGPSGRGRGPGPAAPASTTPAARAGRPGPRRGSGRPGCRSRSRLGRAAARSSRAYPVTVTGRSHADRSAPGPACFGSRRGDIVPCCSRSDATVRRRLPWRCAFCPATCSARGWFRWPMFRRRRRHQGDSVRCTRRRRSVPPEYMP